MEGHLAGQLGREWNSPRSMKMGRETLPQGLKPAVFVGLFGMTKAVSVPRQSHFTANNPGIQ